MSEPIESNALAEWLESPEPGPIPESVSADVAEAIIALRPDLAPPFATEIEDILAMLTEGPLVDPIVAKALRSWLESAPGTAPPSTLPIGVVEAAYALRPELAPSLDINIDDILGSVQQGPLAERTVVPLNPSGTQATDRPIQRVAREAMLSTRRRWWTGTAVTATAVAATALMVVSPVSEEATMSPSPFTDDQSAQADTISRIEQPVSMLQEQTESLVVAAEPKAKEADIRPSPAARTPQPSPPVASRRSTAAAPVSGQSRISPPVRKAEPAPSAPTVVRAAPMAERNAVTARPATQDGGSATMNIEANGVTDSIPPPVMHGMRAVEEERSAEAPPPSDQGGTRLDFESASLPDGIGLDGGGESMASDGSTAAPSTAYSASTKSPRGDLTAHNAAQRGRTLFESGRYDEALKAVENGLQAPSIDPITAARLWRLKAQILNKLGRETEAKQARKRAATIDPLR